ncbi:hypothetical protein [uncultured Flavobacterium sp.]|uniref:hypothetical protein n=1 Tax=uncultured Flavobacterium sp. TaxID=165435 RepID=UPI0030ED05EB
MANKTSQHILSTSANLLGFCLFVITSLHMTDTSKDSLIDEFTSIVALALTISSLLSFFSIRTQKLEKEIRLEKLADNFFISSLVGIFAIILFIIVMYWNQ